MKKLITCFVLMGSAGLTACSSGPKVGIDHAGEEKILSRIDELGSRPNWVDEQTPFKIENQKVFSLGQTVIPAGDNLSAAYRIAENNAKASVSSAIAQKLTYFFQSAEEGIALGASQARYIGEETSRLSTSYLRLSHRYWEKTMIIGKNGQPSIQLRVFVAVEMPEDQFRASVVDAVRQAQGRQGISAAFAAKVDREWDKLTAEETPKAPDSRMPSSENKPASLDARTASPSSTTSKPVAQDAKTE